MTFAHAIETGDDKEGMKIRTIYFKVTDMPKAVAFWQSFLGIEPHKTFPQ